MNSEQRTSIALGLPALLEADATALATFRDRSGTERVALGTGDAPWSAVQQGLERLAGLRVEVGRFAFDPEAFSGLTQAGALAVRAPWPGPGTLWSTCVAAAQQAGLVLVAEVTWSAAAMPLEMLEPTTGNVVEFLIQPSLQAPPSLAVVRQRLAGLEPGNRTFSRFWPDCAGLGEHPVVLVPPSALRAAGVQATAACSTCSQARACPGVLPAFADQAQALHSASPRSDTAGLLGGFDRDCAELHGLRLGLRQAWRLALTQPQVQPFTAFIQSLGLQLARSQRLWAASAGGAWLEPAVDANATDDQYVAVVAQDLDLAEKLLALELENLSMAQGQSGDHLQRALRTAANHRQLGAAYGYPSCCVEAFCDAHAEQLHRFRSSDNALAILRAHLRTQVHHRLLDTLFSPTDTVLWTPLRHLPCRFDCTASLALARALLSDGPEPPAQAVILLQDGTIIRLDAAHMQGSTLQFSFAQLHPSSALTPTDCAALHAGLIGGSLRLSPGESLVLMPDSPETFSWPQPGHLPWHQRLPLLLPFGGLSE